MLNPASTRLPRVPGLLFLLLGLPLSAQTVQVPQWTATTGDVVYSSAAVAADGTIYIGSEDTHLYAFRADGTLLWKHATGNGTEVGDYVDSSPAIGFDGTIYVGCWDGYLYAIHPDGSRRWRFGTSSLISASPAVDAQGRIYFGSTDTAFYCLNPDGSVRWVQSLGVEIDSSAAIDPAGLVYVGAKVLTQDGLDTRAVVYSFDPSAATATARLRWTYRDPFDFNTSPGSSRILGSPALGPDGTLYCGLGYSLDSDTVGVTYAAGALVALDPSTGAEKWRYNTAGKIDSSPVVTADGRVYFATREGILYSLSTAGQLRWQTTVGDVFYSGATLGQDGTVFIVGYAGSGLSRLYAFGESNNQPVERWRADLPHLVDSSPVLTPEGTLLVGCYDGKLYAYPAGTTLRADGWPKFRYDWSGRANQQFPVSAFAFFPQAAALEGGWAWTPGAGYFFPRLFPWIYVTNQGWWYCVGRDDQDMWVYDLSPQLQWCWTSRTMFPSLYSTAASGWLLYLEGTTAPRQFWDYTANQVLTTP